MELKLDLNKTYAIALEGGGAKGSYEVGVWKALDEAGIKYNAVAGTSVGALNGAMMAMRDLPGAIRAWLDVRLSDIVSVDEKYEDEMLRIFSGEGGLADIKEMLPQALDIIKNRGLDVSPLRRWVTGLANTKKIKNSDVELFVTTVALSDKKTLDVRVNELPEDEICDMLLASAYHPTFRLEKLGGKYYADGGFFDSLPIYPLVEAGYKDIIAVCIPGKGIHRRFKLPGDVSVTYIDTDSDLGGTLNFDYEQSKRNLEIGYYDAKRVLYGLSGSRYYVERSMDERAALDALIDFFHQPDGDLRTLTEYELPRLAGKLDLEDGSYYDILIAHCERLALKHGLETMKIYTDTELVALVKKLEE